MASVVSLESAMQTAWSVKLKDKCQHTNEDVTVIKHAFIMTSSSLR